MFEPRTLVFNTPIRIQHRVEADVNGAPDISYTDADSPVDYCNWKGRGGTESVQAGSWTVTDTAELTMWYRPDINERDQVLLNDDPLLAYEVMNVENVDMRSHYLILKVKRAVNA